MITGIVFVCDECGSDRVMCHATALWDVEKQKWVLERLNDDFDDYCYACEDNRFLIDRRVNLTDISKSVIKKEEANEATAAA